MKELIEKQNAINIVKEIKARIWDVDIPSPTVPEYIEHHEQMKELMDFCDECLERIYKKPVVDVRENVRGEWVSTKTNVYPTCYVTLCSVCNFIAFYSCNGNMNNHYNFCPNCGADMRKGENNG